MTQVSRPLEGIVVVELATFIAGPSCARFLGDLGARVIKVEAFNGDPLRYTAINEGRPVGELENTSFDLENANKECIALNLKAPEGREVMDKLLKKADVFITNWRQPALERAKLDYETLKVVNPSLVFGYVSGYGEKGPDKDLPGFDFTAYYSRGGILGTLFDPEHVPMNMVPGFGDHQVGIYLASGVIAALMRAKMTGQGDRVVVSLLHTAIWDVGIMLQSNQFGDSSTQYPISRKKMTNPLQVPHKTKDDRWIEIAMPRYDYYYPIFMKAIGRVDLIEDARFFPQEALQPNLEMFYDILVSEMAKRTVEEWVKIFTEADIPFALAQTWDELLVDKQAWESDCYYKMKYDNGAERTLVRTPVQFTETELPPYVRGPYLGEQTKEILSFAGYDNKAVSELVEGGIAKVHNSVK